MATFTVGSRTKTATAPAAARRTDPVVDDDGERKPSETTDRYYLFEHGNEDGDGGGKWMLFYPMESLDAAWMKAKRLYRTGKLKGVISMKTSTSRPNDRASSNDHGVIIFYCGPPSDEPGVTATGHVIVAAMEYRSYNHNPFVFYKSDEQTLAGTRATGRQKNHLYKIRIPSEANEGEDFYGPNRVEEARKRKRDEVTDDVTEVTKRVSRLSPTKWNSRLSTTSSVHPSTITPKPAVDADGGFDPDRQVRIKFRLDCDGNRTMTGVFDRFSRVYDLCAYLDSHVPERVLRTWDRWRLLVSFPPRELSPPEATLMEAGLFNDVVIAERVSV